MINPYDVIIIGGGPAGMIAAGKASENNKKVLILEKNNILGKKLLITGGGRCNLTNSNLDFKKIYKDSGKYLTPTFSQFGVLETLDFFHKKGLETKEEAGGRIFPKTNKSVSVLNILKEYINNENVTVKTNAAVKSVVKKKDIFEITLQNNELYKSKSCVIATGGLSHPETGSTGDGFNWLRELGHEIIDNDFALVPIAVKDSWVKELSGLTLQDIKISVYCDNQKIFFKKGKILFTHFGVSGPTILNMSKQIGELIPQGETVIHLDIFPGKSHENIRTQLNEILQKESNKMIKNTLTKIVTPALAISVLDILKINKETFNHSLSRENRIKIVDTIKSLPIHVDYLLGADKAIISSGGVDIKEVDFKTMESKIVPKLFLVGDVLNIDRPSGGYSLQLCWTTGYVAGKNA